jgi:hypothetical protein
VADIGSASAVSDGPDGLHLAPKHRIRGTR